MRWMICGPEISSLINQFQSSQEMSGNDLLLTHLEQTKSVQATLTTQVRDLCDTIDEMGNPFTEVSSDLLVLDTRDFMDNSVIETVQHIEEFGQQQYKLFIEERLFKEQNQYLIR